MTIKKTSWILCAALLVAGLTLDPTAVEARGPGGDQRRIGDEIKRGGPESGVRADRQGPRRIPRGKDPACVRECRNDHQVCFGDARDGAKTCFEETCSLEAQATCESCLDGLGSEECRSARGDTRACRATCDTPLRDIAGTCREELRGCVDTCPAAEPKDRTCLRECRAELRECQAPVRDAVKECREGCAGLREAAAAACEENRCSESCNEARAEAKSCLDDCAADDEDIQNSCRAAAGACNEACPVATP